MPDDAEDGDRFPHGFAIHATAVAIFGRALLIRGPSRAGKSRLAFALIARSTRNRPIRLIGDDRILLSPSMTGLIARPHPRIAGFMERRGLGIVSMPFVPQAPVAGIVDLRAPLATSSTSCPLGQENFPLFPIVNEEDADARRDLVLRWFRGACATCAQHPATKMPALTSARSKD